MSSNDADYSAMRMRQKHKKGFEFVKDVQFSVENSDMVHSENEIILQAYIQSFCAKKKIVPEHPLMLPLNLSNHIQRLYKDGVLNLRIGGL